MNQNTINATTGFSFTAKTAELLNKAGKLTLEAIAHACIEAGKADLKKEEFRDAFRNASKMKAADYILALGLKLAKEGMKVTALTEALGKAIDERNEKERKARALKKAEADALAAKIASGEVEQKVAEVLDGKPTGTPDFEAILTAGVKTYDDATLLAYKAALVRTMKVVRAEQRDRAQTKLQDQALVALTAEAKKVAADAVAEKPDLEKEFEEQRAKARAEKAARKARAQTPAAVNG